MKRTSVVILAFIVFSMFSNAQISDRTYRRTAIMNGNNVKTVFGNWGVIGQPGDIGPRGAWLHETNGYIGEEAIIIGVEFPIKDYNNDGKADTLYSVISTPTDRPTQQRDEDPNSSKPWTFEPVGGYFNHNQQNVAISNNPQSWPASWNGMWNGLNGLGTQVADLETYFQMNDGNDERWSFPSNNSWGVNFTGRVGQGIKIDVRYFQFKHPLFNDVLFKVYDITNENSFSYKKAVFGTIVGTYVGVTGTDGVPQEYNDDYSILHKKENVIVAGDFKGYKGERSRNPLWNGPFGNFATAFIDAPNNDTIASYNYFTPANAIRMADDDGPKNSSIWQKIKPGSFSYPSTIKNDTIVLAGEDGDYVYGSNYFTLDSGQTKRIASVLAYGNTADEIFQKVKMAKVLYNNNFDLSVIGTRIQLKNLSSHATLNGNYQITWLSEKITSTVDIYFSSDAGDTWLPIEKDLNNNGSYLWNTANVPDCPFGLLRIYLKDSQSKLIGYSQSGYFAIDNAGNGTPFVKMLDTVFSASSPIVDKSVSVNMLIGDADNATLSLQTLYDAGWGYALANSQVVQSDTVTQKVNINLETMQNSNSLTLKFVLSDGNSTDTVSTLRFAKQTPRSILPQTNANFISQNVSDPGVISINVFDRSKVTNDSYIISFADTVWGKPINFSVFNKTKGSYAIKNVPLVPFSESPSFDGLTLFARDIATNVDSIMWNRNLLFDIKPYLNGVDILQGFMKLYKHPVDYKMIVYDHFVDTSLAHPDFSGILDAMPIKFKVVNQKSGIPAKVYFFGNPDDLRESQWIAVENINSVSHPTWTMFIPTTGDTSVHIKGGDTLNILIHKGISFYDSISISNVAMKVGLTSNIIPQSYTLSQNYPNPFNPTTCIRYTIPNTQHVTLKIYDILGKEVATLVNGQYSAGSYSTEWNAVKAASGIYFYRLTAGSFTETKRMVLIK